MGGEHSGCEENTVDVFLECAFFDPVSVARTGRKLQIVSDSRYRFERFVNPSDLEQTADIATKMIVDICGGQPSDLVVAGKTPDLTKKATLRHFRIKEFLGLDILLPECLRILNVLGFNPQENNGVIICTSPAWRNDVEGEHDLMEEVFRIYGYDKIPLKFIDRAPMPKMNLTPLQRLEITIRHALAANGLLEAATWSFTSSKYTADFLKDGQKAVMIKNPISADLDQMRPSLLINLLLSAARNIDRGYSDEGLFEIGPEFNDILQMHKSKSLAGLGLGITIKGIGSKIIIKSMFLTQRQMLMQH
jgi:phenylalanyl-tRNA synthetase beta chain